MNAEKCIEFLKSERDKYYSFKMAKIDYFTKQKYNNVIDHLEISEKIRNELLSRIKTYDRK